MDQYISRSVIACAIEPQECAVLRMKTAGQRGYSLCSCKVLPFGLDTLASGKEKQLLAKIGNHISAWKDEELAICIHAENYLPLITSIPADTTTEKHKEYCMLEAEHFLTQPEKFDFDTLCYTSANHSDNKQLLLFYPAEPGRTISALFAQQYHIRCTGTPQLPLLELSKFSEEPQVILAMEQHYLLLTITRKGIMKKFSCHQIKTREECEYFAMKELLENPICRNIAVQVIGTRANKGMIDMLSQETSITLRPLSLPPSTSISGAERFATSSPTMVKAISTALMALSMQNQQLIA